MACPYVQMMTILMQLAGALQVARVHMRDILEPAAEVVAHSRRSQLPHKASHRSPRVHLRPMHGTCAAVCTMLALYLALARWLGVAAGTIRQQRRRRAANSRPLRSAISRLGNVSS